MSRELSESKCRNKTLFEENISFGKELVSLKLDYLYFTKSYLQLQFCKKLQFYSKLTVTFATELTFSKKKLKQKE